MADIVRLPSSVGVGTCLRCGGTCMAGWSHFGPDEGYCGDCAFLIAGPEFVRDVLALPDLAADLHKARTKAVRAANRAARRVAAPSTGGE